MATFSSQGQIIPARTKIARFKRIAGMRGVSLSVKCEESTVVKAKKCNDAHEKYSCVEPPGSLVADFAGSNQSRRNSERRTSYYSPCSRAYASASARFARCSSARISPI